MNIRPADSPDEDLRRAIAAPLLRFNEDVAGASGYELLAFALTDDAGQTVGGLWGHTSYGWLYTQMLTVPEACHGQGWGRRLMAQAEDEARRRGCHHAWVDTIFGARPFYEGLGYRVFGELPNFPTGFTRSFLMKDLA